MNSKDLKKYIEDEKNVLELARSIKERDPGRAFWDGYVPSLRKKLDKKPGFFDFLKKPVPVSLIMLVAVVLLASPIYLSRQAQKNALKAGPETEAAILADIEQNYDEYAKILFDDPVEENLMLEDAGIE